MFSSRRANNLVKKIHENHYETRFNGLLGINNEATFHVKNNQKLMIKVYNYANGLSDSVIDETISKRNIE